MTSGDRDLFELALTPGVRLAGGGLGLQVDLVRQVGVNRRGEPQWVLRRWLVREGQSISDIRSQIEAERRL